jgi:hypothetical protein
MPKSINRAQRIRDLYQAGELRPRIPELIEQMGFPRPSRQAVFSALKAQYDRPGRPFSALTDVGLIHEIYEAYREGVATLAGMRISTRLKDAILVAELRVGENEIKRANTARKRQEARDADGTGLKASRSRALDKTADRRGRKAERRRGSSAKADGKCENGG